MNVTILSSSTRKLLQCYTPLPALPRLEPSFPNVKKAIRNAVLNNGKSIIDFPEAWGDDLMDVSQVEVDKALQLLKLLSVYNIITSRGRYDLYW